jgi:hypothetical protein
MNYYILTQGTKSQDFSFVVKNGQILQPDDNQREFIRNLFEITEKNGKLISSKVSQTKIIKHKNNYLIEVLTTNTDRLNRKIPVELLINSFSKNNLTNLDLNNIYIILVSEQIIVDESNWKNILFQLDNDIKKFKQTKNIKIVTGISIAFITIFLTLKFILKWI